MKFANDTDHSRARAPPPTERNDHGFALLVVIWFAGLVALLMLSFAAAARVHLRSTGHAVELAEARALADGGTDLALAELLRTSLRGETSPLLGRSRTCRMANGDVLTLSLADEAGRVDPNVAGEELLTALFIGAGTPTDAARRIANAVLDFRDGDDEPRKGGAERDDYRAARRASIPRNAPFETVAELAEVMGVTAAHVQRLSPYLTVRSGQEGIDSAAADGELIAMLARGAAADSLAARLSAIVSETTLPVDFRVASAGQAFAIRAAATTGTGATFVREAVVGIAAAGTSGATRERRPVASADTVGSVRARSARRRPAQPTANIWEWRRVGMNAAERRTASAFRRSGTLVAC